MNKKLNIRELYHPVQPAISGINNQITYLEVQPDKRLQEFIYCYWQLQTTDKLQDPFCYRVVADGCIDIFFELKNPDVSYVMGFSDHFTEFPIGTSFNYTGIRFLPAMFSQLFRINASELSNRFEPLDTVIPKTADYISRFLNPKSPFSKQKRALDRYFFNHIHHSGIQADHRLLRALNSILANRGNLKLGKELGPGLSQRQIRRLFKQKVGGTAKAFSRIVRFQHVLQGGGTGRERFEPLFFDAGYYDQSHFIKEFNQLYGKTPSEVLFG